MKSINLIKRITLFFLLIISFGCSKESINDTEDIIDAKINKREAQTQNQARYGNLCADSNTIHLYIVHNFPPNSTPLEQSVIKNNYFNSMSSLFTICYTLNTDCDNVDVWSVNENEFNANYVPDEASTRGTGSSNNNEDNMDDPGEVFIAPVTIDNSTDCATILNTYN